VIAGDWRTEPNALVRELTFKDYAEALRFVDLLGERAVDYERRPDVSIVDFNRVRIYVDNLHHAGITEAERRLARKVDAVLADWPAAGGR
jgi:4a-hydroxytetrahydrobiopterin dehydratase